ncbi:hypothetical protein IIE18_23690 [Pseudomonas sp. V1]|nr:hypothetical protein [Pseudomonas arcuscaelestis]MBM3108127.1 hypothetical protein [Pseudomonas arcuscaelestis]
MHKARASKAARMSARGVPLVFAQIAVFAGDKPLSKKRTIAESVWIQGF